MNRNVDWLSNEYTIDTPESVTFGYETAGIGSRFVAALVDSVAVVLALIVLNVILLVLLWLSGDLWESSGLLGDTEISWAGGLILAIYALVNFFVFWGYYILFEYLWNGQTPGKRLAGIRVVRTDGSPAGFTESAIRNLVRVVDFLPSGYGLGLVVMFFGRQDRRLGDYAAGTLVVKARRDVDVKSLTPVAGPVTARVEEGQSAGLLMAFPTIRRLTAGDYELIQDTLRRDQEDRIEDALLPRLASAIAAKLDVTPPDADDAGRFLWDVMMAYRSLGR
jgi:uncharacterized RDD family membrane protein YckC